MHLAELGHPAWNRYRRIFQVIGHFLVGQTALQGLQVLSGLLLIRYLSLTEYAVYAYVLTAQATGAILNDLGARNALIALCGPSHRDKKTVADFIATALFLRGVLTVLGAGVMLALLATFHFTHETSLFSLFLYFILCTIAIYLNSWTSYFTIPFLLEHRMSELYGPQILAGAVRIGLIVGLASIGWLTAESAIAIGALLALVLGAWFRRESKRKFGPEGKKQGNQLVQIRGYILALLPATLWAAFQDQIVVFLLSLFGRVENIAEASALGRLGQLFQVLTAANGTLIAPWFAKAEDTTVIWKYAMVVSMGLVVAVTIGLAAFGFPQWFLWILGPQYSGLVVEFKFSIAAACVNYVAALMWTVNSARRWVYRWSGASFVLAAATAEAIMIGKVGVSTTLSAILVSGAVAIASLMIQFIHSAIGLRAQYSRRDLSALHRT